MGKNSLETHTAVVQTTDPNTGNIFLKCHILWEKERGKGPTYFLTTGHWSCRRFIRRPLQQHQHQQQKGDQERERESHHCAAPPPKERVPPPPKTAAKSYSWHCRKKKEDQGLIQRSLLRPRCQNASLLPERKAPFSFYIRLSSYFWGARTQFSHTKNRSVLFSSSAVSVRQR